MRDALLIFRKDVRHLWPRVIPLLALSALLGWMECALFVINPILETLRGVWLLSAAYLVASVIHQESLPGHQQYWLTRPFGRRQLVLAKGLFLAVFAGVPVLAIDAVSLSSNGVSPFHHFPLLLFATLIFAGGACLIVAALASVTENLVQLLWGLLPALGVVIFGFVLAGTRDHATDWQWGNLEWIRTSALGAILLAVAVTVLCLQYSSRKTALSRCLLAGAILIAAASPFLGSWHAAWALENNLTGRRQDESAVRLAFDPSPRPAVGFADATWTPGNGDAGINLPILVTGIPTGTEVVCERIATRIDGPEGKSWTATWTRVGGIYRTTPLEDPFVIPTDGPYWEYINLGDTFYQSVKDMPVHLHTTVALTLLGGRKTVPLVTRDRSQSSLDDGICRVGPGPFGKLSVSCAWLGHTPDRSYVTAVSARNGQTYTGLISTGSGGPYSLNGSVWERASTLFSAPPATREMELETWQAVTHFDRDLDLPQIRLGGYAVRRITDTP